MIAVGTPVVSDDTRRLCLGAGLVGTAAFLYGVLLGDSIRAWQSLLVNFLFFGGLAQAGVVLSAMMQVTSSRWGRALKRTAEATSAFLPVSFVLLLVLLAGVSAWAPWVHAPVEAKQAWLNIPFFVTRQVLGCLLLGGISLAYVYRSVRPDIYAKGADYDPRDGGRELPELATVRAVGARLELIPLVPGVSTTALLDKLRGPTVSDD